MHDYFYGVQSGQFSFIRIPTLLFTDDQYKYVSADAKILYGILLARMDLSAKNGWIDDQGRVYIICTLSEIMEKLNCADNKATKLMNELEDKCGLIERKRQGLGKPNLIYVKNFLPVDNPVESRFKTRENHDSGVAEITIVKITILESRKSRFRTRQNHDQVIKKINILILDMLTRRIRPRRTLSSIRSLLMRSRSLPPFPSLRSTASRITKVRSTIS